MTLTIIAAPREDVNGTFGSDPFAKTWCGLILNLRSRRYKNGILRDN